MHNLICATPAILDTKPLTSGALPPEECARPRLHEFLEAVYPFYDICIWYVALRKRSLRLLDRCPWIGRRLAGYGLKLSLWNLVCWAALTTIR